MKKIRTFFSLLLSLAIIAGVIAPSSVLVKSAGENDSAPKTQKAQEIYTRDYIDSAPTLITGEVTELRTETEKHFRHEDGSYTVSMYSAPVHFQDANGEWREIDNTLELNESRINDAGKAVYTPRASGLDVQIPQDFSDGQAITVEKEGYQISFGVATDAQSESVAEALPDLLADSTSSEPVSDNASRSAISVPTEASAASVKATVSPAEMKNASEIRQGTVPCLMI